MPPSKILTMAMAAEEGVKTLLKTMLENGKISGIIAIKKQTLKSDGNRGATTASFGYSLVADSAELESLTPLFPVMPTNVGKILSHITHLGKFPSLIAVVVHPCELRALIEMVKRDQAIMENLLIISMTCGGVLPTMKAFEDDEAVLAEYWSAVQTGEPAQEVRPTCRGCVQFIPTDSADMTVLLLGGETRSKCRILLNTDRAVELAVTSNSYGLGEIIDAESGAISTTTPMAKELIETVMAAREQTQASLEQGLGLGGGIGSLVNIFGRCIGCHACGNACPICYCQLCRFEREAAKQETPLWERELARRGAFRVPSNTIYYHIGRMTHMAISCVACGSCTDVCPVDIPVAALFKTVGEATQSMLDYVPGRDVNEEIPIRMFEHDEFHSVEE